jgi:hypothetical protein
VTRLTFCRESERHGKDHWIGFRPLAMPTGPRNDCKMDDRRPRDRLTETSGRRRDMPSGQMGDSRGWGLMQGFPDCFVPICT